MLENILNLSAFSIFIACSFSNRAVLLEESVDIFLANDPDSEINLNSPTKQCQSPQSK